MAGATNLVIALPKVGKFRLMTIALGRLKRGDDAFLGQMIPSSNPLFLIVGPGQTEHYWQECLHRAGHSDASGVSIVSFLGRASLYKVTIEFNGNSVYAALRCSMGVKSHPIGD
ncbi:MAG: hypothetical protein VYE46_07885 [Cyanobacteriota bacterium]|nr:hypothetical protein [Cyanobacteriota bacterium]